MSADVHNMPDVYMAGNWQLTFNNKDAGNPCSVMVEVSPGSGVNTFWMRVYHDNKQVSEHLVKLPNYQPGSEIQL